MASLVPAQGTSRHREGARVVDRTAAAAAVTAATVTAVAASVQAAVTANVASAAVWSVPVADRQSGNAAGDPSGDLEHPADRVAAHGQVRRAWPDDCEVPSDRQFSAGEQDGLAGETWIERNHGHFDRAASLNGVAQ